MAILCLLRWAHIILTVLLVAATVATMSIEETFREAASSSPPPQKAQRKGAVSLARTIGIVIGKTGLWVSSVLSFSTTPQKHS
jgi:hypothetical protein